MLTASLCLDHGSCLCWIVFPSADGEIVQQRFDLHNTSDDLALVLNSHKCLGLVLHHDSC